MALNILLVDDDSLGNLLVSSILEDMSDIENFKIATSGDEAISYLSIQEKENNFPDLILVDIKMPEIDGFEFIEICEQKFTCLKNKKVMVVLSSSVREKDRTQAMGYASVIDFISKPITEEKISELANIVSQNKNQ